MQSSFLNRIKIKKNVILRKKKNRRHLLDNKSSSRKRRLRISVKVYNLKKFL